MAFGFDDAIAAGLKVLDKFIPDPNKRAEAEEALRQKALEAYNAGLVANAQANVEEAKHPSIFVAGWRPAIGWTCAIVLFAWYVPMALVSISIWLYICYKTGAIVERPDISIQEVVGLVMSLLGIGTLRTVEKIKQADTRGVVGKITDFFKGK